MYALGTILNCPAKRTDHADTVDQGIGMSLISSVAHDASPLVRKELVVALQWLLAVFETQFVAVAFQFLEEETKEQSTFLSPGTWWRSFWHLWAPTLRGAG